MELQRGDNGDEVEDLQRSLNAIGAALTVDGKFGKNTFAAVVRFQEALGIEADGVVGVGTRLALAAARTAGITLDFRQQGQPAANRPDLPADAPDEVEACADSLAELALLANSATLEAIDEFARALEGPAKVDPDLLGAVTAGAYEFAVDVIKDNVPDRFAFVITVVESVQQELRRAAAAQDAMALDEWVRAQTAFFVNQRNAIRAAVYEAGLNQFLARSADPVQALSQIRDLRLRTEATRPPAFEEILLRLCEEWIDGQFVDFATNADGCLVYHWRLIGGFLDFVALRVSASREDQLQRLLNELLASGQVAVRRPIELRVRKRVRIDVAVPPASMPVRAWVDAENRLLREPDSPGLVPPAALAEVATIIEGPLWRSPDRFVG